MDKNSYLLLRRDNGLEESILFLHYSTYADTWEGPQFPPEKAVKIFSVDKVESTSRLPEYLSNKLNAYIDIDENSHLRDIPDSFIQRADKFKMKKLVESMRMYKSKSEMDLMRKAAAIISTVYNEISTCAIKEAISKESHIASLVECRSKILGADMLSFVPVVASGERSNIIHYTDNNQNIPDDSLILLDSGALYQGYCSDLTRVWPKSGQFQDAQWEIYQSVLTIQQKCIESIRVGVSTLESIHDVAVNETITELYKLGFKDPCKYILELFPHSACHYLGMDLHDTSTCSSRLPLSSGVCFTIEPGLYIPYNEAFPEKYRGIGVRLEDDIAIIGDQVEILTKDALKYNDRIV